MQTPRDILADLWILAGGDAAALEAITLTADEPPLPSSFRVAAAAQTSIAASGLAAAELPVLTIEDWRGTAQALACGAWAERQPPAVRPARARSVAGDRRSRCRPHARRAWRRRDAGVRSGFAGDPLAHHRHRPRQA